ncbi:LINE-1 retrotransposable element ORF2 protein [Symbiodinium microadriaticum]|uniref:LINE-1 retrotransposable element ORF2 protein n=1 Tax=Symbiodinium microadriaticum TaxID=2951 RepID=A0A1Q9DYT5_SYMMI|nr:LINE-1 retrotransposable element ORF2 protein [Symbiodinium microadriaticum]CAE7631163.1 unnamed protein product [Symbiodinium microadriaticum]
MASWLPGCGKDGDLGDGALVATYGVTDSAVYVVVMCRGYFGYVAYGCMELQALRDHEDALKDDGTHIGPFGPRRALGSFRCGLTAMLMGGALSFFFIDVLGGADVDYMCAFAARLRVGSDSFLAALPFSFDKLDGMDEYNLDVCAGALFGFDRPNLSDANDVAYNFVGCFSDDFHLGRETVVDGADRVRLDPHAGRRIGEASHPGPAGSRRTKRLRSQAFDKVAVRKICQQVLREFVAEWNGQGNVDAGDRGCSWNRSSDRWWTERTGELYHASTTRAPWDDQSDNDYQAAADNHGRRHDHMHNWWGSSTTSRADDSSSTWASWDDAAVAGARAGRAVSYYSAVSPEASWHTTQDDWWASSSRQRWADMLDDGPEDPVVAGQQHDVARGWGPTRRVEINTSAVGRDLSSKSRWRRKHAKAQPLDRDGADIDGASCEGPWALRKDVWHASCPIVFAASASAVSEILDSAAGVAIVAWTDNSHTADEIWELVASEGLDADGADVSLTLLCESTPSNAQWTPGDNTPPDVIPVPGTVDGKLRHKKCLMVTSGASPAKLSTRQTGTHEVRKPPPSLAAQRAASVVVRFTADCVYGTTPWADLKKQPAQRARSWASQHGVRQADIIDAYGFGVHGDNRLTGLMRIRNEVSARKLWTASGAFAAGLVFFVDVIGEGHRNLTANWAKDDDIVVQWHDWEVQESFEEYRARVLKFASFGLVLGRRLGCRLGSKDPNFKAQPSLWRARAIPHNYGIADVAALLEDLGFSQVGVQTLHRGRKTNDWTFRGMRDDRQTMLQQHIAWGGGLESDLVVVRESARRGPAGQDSQFAPITERRTVTFGDAMQQRPSSRKPKKDKSRPAASAPSVSPPLGSAPHSGEVAESDVQTSKGTKRAGPEDTAKMSVDAEARDASWAPVATLLDNPGGGNCLFWAMAQAGFQNKAPNEVTHRQMRRFAVQCLQSQESDLGVMWARAGSFNSLGRPSELTWPQYITEISTAANWGGSLEVAAVCIGTDFRAWIFEHKEDRLSLLNPSGKAGFVLLQYDSEKQHWQAFREVNEETLLARHRDTGEAMFDVVASQLRGGMAKPSLSECASVSSENQCDDAHSSGGDAARPGRFLTLSECASSLDGGPTEVEQVCSGAQGGGSVPGPSPSATRVGPLWSDEQRWAYAALCSALFDAETLQGEPTIREAVGAAFGGLASCPAAARGVLAHLSDEVALLHGHADADPWTSEQHHAIRTVLGELHRIFDHCRLPSLSECASSCGGDDVHGGVDGHADPPCASRRVRGKQTAPCISFVTRGFGDSCWCMHATFYEAFNCCSQAEAARRRTKYTFAKGSASWYATGGGEGVGNCFVAFVSLGSAPVSTCDLKVATHNVGRASIVKMPAVLDVIRDLDVVALQEIDLHPCAAPHFIRFWKGKGFRTCLGAVSASGVHRVALLSKLALRQVGLDIEHNDRQVTAVLGTYRPILFSSCYGHAGDAPTAKAFAHDLAHALSRTGHPWVALGDYNLEESDLFHVFATGCASSMDEPFKHGAPLPPTRHDARRRIDFGIAAWVHPTSVFHREGVSDHLLVGYIVDGGCALQGHCGPKRAPVCTEADRSTAEVGRLWHAQWCIADFQAYLAKHCVDKAWTLLSNTAEAALCSPSPGATRRSADWTPRVAATGHRAMLSPETVALRRLRRLERRLRQLQKEPCNRGLYKHVGRDMYDLARTFPELGGHLDPFGAVCSELVRELISKRETQEHTEWLARWQTRLKSSEASRRRWVQRKCRDQQEYVKSISTLSGETGQISTCHPSRLLHAAQCEWQETWRRGAVDRVGFAKLLKQVPRPTVDNPQLEFRSADLLAAAKTMAGRAGGPDAWLAENLCRLPSAFWCALAELWGVVMRTGALPARWLECRVCLIPKADGGLRPLSITSVLWRIGTKVIVGQLRPWLLSWLDEKTLGGVYGGSVLHAHLLFHAEWENSVFVTQDLHRFFDTVDWSLLQDTLRWLRAPACVVRLVESFYAQGRCVLNFDGLLSPDFFTVQRGLLQGCPLSPLLAACFLKVWGTHVGKGSVKTTSFVDDRTFWALATGRAMRDVEVELISAYRRSNEFDRCCAFSCRPVKCKIASGRASELQILQGATSYNLSSVLECLGLTHDLVSGGVTLTSESLEDACLRARNIAKLPCDMAGRARLFRALVIPKFVWAAGVASVSDDTLWRLRQEMVSVFTRQWCADTPLLIGLELLGWECDPCFQSCVLSLAAAFRYHCLPPRWHEHVGLDVVAKKWPCLFRDAARWLAKLGWWVSCDGGTVSRRDDQGIIRSFAVGFDSFRVIQRWVRDYFRKNFASRIGRIASSLHRHQGQNLAQGLDLPGPPAGSVFLLQGHKQLFQRAATRMQVQAAMTTGCSVWHTFGARSGGMREEDPRAVCICGKRLPSRPHLCWTCPATAHVRQSIEAPSDRARERLFAVPLPEMPGPPCHVLDDDAVTPLVGQLEEALSQHTEVFAATDGSECDDIAAWAVVLPQVAASGVAACKLLAHELHQLLSEARLKLCKCWLAQAALGGAPAGFGTSTAGEPADFGAVLIDPELAAGNGVQSARPPSFSSQVSGLRHWPWSKRWGRRRGRVTAGSVKSMGSESFLLGAVTPRHMSCVRAPDEEARGGSAFDEVLPPLPFPFGEALARGVAVQAADELVLRHYPIAGSSRGVDSGLFQLHEESRSIATFRDARRNSKVSVKVGFLSQHSIIGVTGPTFVMGAPSQS